MVVRLHDALPSHPDIEHTRVSGATRGPDLLRPIAQLCGLLICRAHIWALIRITMAIRAGSIITTPACQARRPLPRHHLSLSQLLTTIPDICNERNRDDAS